MVRSSVGGFCVVRKAPPRAGGVVLGGRGGKKARAFPLGLALGATTINAEILNERALGKDFLLLPKEALVETTKR